ncbi:MAG: DUF1844 domain-containing protein [Candidatus Marinimicrobia bacterium]|nr:DUF1844 domain-containing protein [Candidatus Neomarinimicrobiota bacterium]
MADKISSEQLFMGLVYSLVQSAFISLGKLPDPMSGKIERELEQASQTIDLLAALHEKTTGNLSGEEEKFLSGTISDLRLNYVDEVNKAQNEKNEKKPKEDKTAGDKKEDASKTDVPPEKGSQTEKKDTEK